MHKCECAGCIAETTNAQYCDYCAAQGLSGEQIVITTGLEEICKGHIRKCGTT